MNQWLIEARIIERATVRYTPAGVPIISCLLHHCSQTEEAGMPRQIEMDVPAVAAGELSGVLERCMLNQRFCFRGFVAPQRRNARTWVFHITKIETI